MQKPRICVLGGSGFVGHHLVTHLGEQGFPVRVITRHRERHRELLVLPATEVIEGNVHDQEALNAMSAGCDVMINLVAILNERHRGDFEATHIELPRKIVQACLQNHIRRLLHISALNADAHQGGSRYLLSKGAGEEVVHATHAQGVEVTSFRPSVIFGPGDHFFNRFAALLKRSPHFFPLPCPGARFAPVYVEDVVRIMILSLANRATIGQRYDLCGPQDYTLRQLVEFTATVLGLRRRVIGLGNGLSRLQGRIMEHFPGKPFSYDNYLTLLKDSICHEGLPALFGLEPQAIEAQVPPYLTAQGQRAYYSELRSSARHES